MLLTFWLWNALRPSFSCLPWTHGSAPAALASLLFDLTEPQIIGKTKHFATLLTFRAHVSSFFWLSRAIFFLLTLLLFSAVLLLTLLLSSAFQLSILLEVRLLNFLRWSHLVSKTIVSQFGIVGPTSRNKQGSLNNIQQVTIVEGSLNSKLPTIWRVEKQRWKADEMK